MNLNITSATRLGLNALALLGVAVALYLGETIFIPLTFAVLLAAILWPVADWFHTRKLPWSIACMVSVSLMLVLFVGVTLGLSLAVPRMVAGLPNLQDPSVRAKEYGRFREKVERVSPGSIEKVLPEDPDSSQLLKTVEAALRPESVTDMLKQLAGRLGSLLVQLVLIMFIVLFLLMEGRMLSQRLVEVFGPSEEAQSRAVGVLAEIASSVRAYLVWRTVVNIGLAIVLGIVYQSIGLGHPWTWALLAAILCYVPYIGTIIAGVPPVLDAFVTIENPWGALGILIFYVAVVTFEGYVIVPVLMGRSMDLNATTVLLSCLFWDLVWGTPGLFLAMPLMAGLKAVCMSVPEWRPWANLMGTDEETTSHTPKPPPEPLTNSLTPERDKTLPMEAPDQTLIMDPTENPSVPPPVP